MENFNIVNGLWAVSVLFAFIAAFILVIALPTLLSKIMWKFPRWKDHKDPGADLLMKLFCIGVVVFVFLVGATGGF